MEVQSAPATFNSSNRNTALVWVGIALGIVAVVLLIILIVLVSVGCWQSCGSNQETLVIRRGRDKTKFKQSVPSGSEKPLVQIRLAPIAADIDLPTVIKSAVFPGSNKEYIVVCTQVGQVLLIHNGNVNLLLDLTNYRDQSLILNPLGNPVWSTVNNESVADLLGPRYDERGLLGIAFHPRFSQNGRFWLWYTERNSPVKFPPAKIPDSCDPATLTQHWEDPTNLYDHIQVVEEWRALQSSTDTWTGDRIKTMLRIRWPFFNHTSNNALTWSVETDSLLVALGDGGFELDPFNLSQDDSYLHGKVLEIRVDHEAWSRFDSNKSVATFDELGELVTSGAIRAIAKGLRNPVGLIFQKDKTGSTGTWYLAQAGQNLVESIYAFRTWNADNGQILNLGWRGWEGAFPLTTPRRCTDCRVTLTAAPIREISYLPETISLAVSKHGPLVQYYHLDTRQGKKAGTVLTGIATYDGNENSPLYGNLLWSDALEPQASSGWIGTVSASDRELTSLHDFQVAQLSETPLNYAPANYYTTMGNNTTSSRVFLGVYGSFSPLDRKLGKIYEVLSV